MPSYKFCFIALAVFSIVVAAALASNEDETSLVRMARSPKRRATKKPRPSGGDGTHHVPCSATCTNKGHTPTCCAAHGLSGGKCVGEKAFCT
ncbi:hypothetical protein AAVH_18672 [Aphelenchoides avenae]|nr:hypothetical protein AAVH_18672 [Aphelenchus avenae]